jgi:hypothetical protein
MKVYEYKNYDEYIKAQKETTELKYGKLVYIQINVAQAIYESLKNKNIKSILCHGTRSGEEQKLFKEYFGCYVWGSELSEKAAKAEMTTIWDFNKVNPDWVGKFDIVYSNALDHSITPIETLKVWRDQLTLDGRLLIEWSDSQNNKTIWSDPLCATQSEVKEWAKSHGMYLEMEIMKNGAKHGGTVLVFKRNTNEI